MDPVDTIRRLIDEGDSDILSKISEILGVNQLAKSLDKVNYELDQANAKLSEYENPGKDEDGIIADLNAIIRDGNYFWSRVVAMGCLSKIKQLNETNAKLAHAEARIKAYEEQEPVAQVNRNCANQISLRKVNGEPFDMSKYIGAKLFTNQIEVKQK